MPEGDGNEREDGADRPKGDPGMVGVLVRLAIALLAVALGLFWIVRLTFVGSTLRGGLLFELLAPLVLLYFGIDYLQTQRRALNPDSRPER
ncbi:hypothetical protein [Halalkalicoccus ordinarius]|uniref:hypothetical protein n=1 Tax=Halalkalicoccus ordinarius TaxID=3116651 RepID=UPI00300EE8FC